MVPDDRRETTRKLNGAFLESMSIYRLGHGSMPLWYRLALSELVLLIDDKEVSYATGRYDEQSATARFLAVTDDLVIDAHVSNIAADMASRDVRAVPRSSIQSLSVEAGETPFSQSAISNWPGALTVSATYEGLSEPAVFPLERANSSHDAELQLLSALRTDLTAAP